MHRQTIRTFYEVRNGVVRILRTDPVITPLVKSNKISMEGSGKYAKGAN